MQSENCILPNYLPFGLANTLFVTIYSRPNGRKNTTAITKVRAEDVEYFNDNKINVSMEDCGPFFAIYACREGYEPDAIVALPGGRGTRNMIEQGRRAGVPYKDYF